MPSVPRRAARRAKCPHPRGAAQRRLARCAADHSRSTGFEPAPLLGGLLRLSAPHPPPVQAESRPAGFLPLLPRRPKRPLTDRTLILSTPGVILSPETKNLVVREHTWSDEFPLSQCTGRGVRGEGVRYSVADLGGELPLGDSETLVRDLDHTVDLSLAHYQRRREVHHVPDPGHQSPLQAELANAG
jgi:hypothetical protein